MPDDPVRREVAALDRDIDLAAEYRRGDRGDRFPAELFRALGAAHLTGLTLPEAAGGRGLPALRAAGVLFELARRGGTLAAKLALQPEFSSLLHTQGSAELRRAFFR
ncbi:MAG: acyl-CoA dehydrogenase family protein, partial [Thermoplasmata archaeon]